MGMSMNYEIHWLARAEKNLVDIENFIAEDNVQAAIQVSENIEISAGRLIDHPNMGKSGRVKGTRELIVVGTPYILVYRLNGNSIQILSILHGAQLYPSMNN